MSLSKEIEKLKYDKRLLEWSVSRGVLSKEDMKKHLDELPDLESNVEVFDLVGDSDDSRDLGGVGGSVG